MSKGQAATEFEWISGIEPAQSETGKFLFLKEGYLFMTEEETDHTPHGIFSSTSPKATSGGTVVGGAHMVLVRRTSDPTIKGSWRKRWCVLSETADGIHLLYYKHHHSFTNCEAPVGVVLMEDCQKLYTIPNHSKSSHVFAVAFPHRIIMFHPDKGSELQMWLDAFQTALNMKDSSVSSPLKGLPRQKALRKDLYRQSWPRGHEMSPEKHKKTNKESTSAEAAQVLSFRSLHDEADGMKSLTKTSPAPELKGLPKKKALHDRQKSSGEKRLFEDISVPDLDTEGNGAVQFMGFRMLDT